MREKNNYFKLVCWVCVCVFIITGCSNNRSTEEKIFMEGERRTATKRRSGRRKNGGTGNGFK